VDIPGGEWFCPKCEDEAAAGPSESGGKKAGKGGKDETPVKGGKRKVPEEGSAKGESGSLSRIC